MKRSERLVDMTYRLLAQPHQLIPLRSFSELYQIAKSSISEDLAIMKEVLESRGVGRLHTYPGASGGACFEPRMSLQERESLLRQLCQRLEEKERVLPGGYLYISDLLGDPDMVFAMGRLFATHFAQEKPDVVMTIETKGIPLAYATAHYLHKPVVVVSRHTRMAEGSFVSVNYESGSSGAVQTMSLARRSLPVGARVLIIDDFVRAGGTLRGMLALLQEFDAHCCGIGVFIQLHSFHLNGLKVVSLTQVTHDQAQALRAFPGTVAEDAEMK